VAVACVRNEHMTRQKKLKKKVRSRAARSGESYTAARRQVIAARQKRRPAAAAPVPNLTRGAVSAAKVLERTGHGLDHWFSVLDAFGARSQGHTAAARHLSEGHGVDGWYAQGITVAWERLRGVRALNQRVDGSYEVSVSKVVDATPVAVAGAFDLPARRRAWLAGQDPGILQGLEAASRPMNVVRDGAAARLRFRVGAQTVEIRADAKPNGRTSLVAQIRKLASSEDVESRRAAWRAAFESLRAHLSLE
jgi:hypothetical protein